MAGTELRVLVAGGRAEDVRAVDAGVRGLGLTVDWAEPAEATAPADAADILVIVLDLDATGLELGRRLGGRGAARPVPLLFLTNPDSPAEVRARAYALAPAACLTRPVSSEVVRAEAELLLDLRRHPPKAWEPDLEAALRDGKARTAALGDYLSDAAIYQLVQLPGGGRRFTYVSAGIERLLGVTPAEVVADPYALYSLILPEDLPRVVAAEAEAARARSPFDCEFRQRTRDGELRWCRYRTAPRAAGGAVVWDGLITDVTAERKVADALVESEHRFRLMADSAPVLMWIAGPEQRRTWFNKAWLDFTGRPLDQELGAGWTAAVHPDDRDRCLRAYADAFAGRRPFAAEYRLRRHDGAYRWVLDNGAPLSGPAGGFAGYVGSAVDITGHKELEEALRDADRRREDYLHMLAHELRNPLAPLRTGLHVLARRSDDPELVTETRAMMGRQIESMARIVDDLMDAARVARGKVTIRKSRLDLADVARTCADDRRAVAEGAGLRLSFDATGGPVWVDGDATRLSQVLDNLIQNAVKFTPKGGSVAVSVAAESDAAVVRVRDTGTGIDPAIRPHLFEVFTQADRSLDRARGGLGLGLALAKGLVDLHGGTIEAHSEGPGRGSQFVVRLPRSPEPAALTEIPTSPSSIGRRRRVLIVEDNLDSAESLRMLLDLSGYEVEVAHTGPAGVEAAARFRPHTVVCDIGLPGLDGYGVARALRLMPEAAGARLIAVTGYGRTEDVEKARRAGFDVHLTKPVDPHELLEQLVSRAPRPAG
jgi:PAS domain S-box-containing protein